MERLSDSQKNERSVSSTDVFQTKETEMVPTKYDQQMVHLSSGKSYNEKKSFKTKTVIL